MAGDEHAARMLRLESDRACNLSTAQLIELLTERLRRTHGPNVKLMAVGAPGWLLAPIERLVEQAQ